MKYELQYKPYSERAILIEWPSKIDENILQDLLLFKKSIEKKYDELIVEVISGYNSLLIYYASTINNLYDEFSALKSLYATGFNLENKKSTLWEIPVCYSTALAPDLETFCKNTSLTIDELIALHTAPLYKVYFIGFLPGFLYLGGLDEKLSLPRKTKPSLTVKKGSVAIGGNQTGIYPMESPGGWHVIGSCPLDFFDPTLSDPCFISPGDTIRFVSINEVEYNDISSKVMGGLYEVKSVFL